MSRSLVFVEAIPVSSELWCPDEPNNEGNKENAVDLAYYTDSKSLYCLNDERDSDPFAFICERKKRE